MGTQSMRNGSGRALDGDLQRHGPQWAVEAEKRVCAPSLWGAKCEQNWSTISQKWRPKSHQNLRSILRSIFNRKTCPK